MAVSRQALLFVDGYNIIGAWPRLRQTRDLHGLEPARQELIETLVNYAAQKEYKTQIVFDAQYQKTPFYQEDYTAMLSVYYTNFDQTADTYIEKVCASLGRQLSLSSARLIVATSDLTQKNMVIGYGAEWMSALRLQSDVEAVRQSRQNRTRQTSRGRFLFHSLDAKAQQRLQQWRQGLY